MLDDNHQISRHFDQWKCEIYFNLLNSSKQCGVPLSLDSPVSSVVASWLILDELKKKHPVERPGSFEVLLLYLVTMTQHLI